VAIRILEINPSAAIPVCLVSAFLGWLTVALGAALNFVFAEARCSVVKDFAEGGCVSLKQSSAVATSREDHRSPRSGRASLHRRWGRGPPPLQFLRA
jgi:hypothetical protein